MTEVLNYYGRNYRIADILSVERSLGEISPEQGMLNGETSIRRTVAHFGFKATTLTTPTLAEVIATANQGKPVIVSFPPATWAGGHLLVVRGGNATTVYLVDSSSLNMHEMSYAKFTSYWRGFAVIVEPA
jgi:ABC-type bacteriocin/lantibiotic exporter with double-glycine peptidase domain